MKLWREAKKTAPRGALCNDAVMRREEESVGALSVSQRIPKTFKPMITTIGTPQSQRMMLFMKVSGVLM
ncbi:MAG: hypothetical protein ABIQ82_12365 [Variovorax sp.]